mmetsp:Transcript_27852/g.80783  ORF Transcript_27852/g.80783 Transcript_27852/m.80783 type:complete len:201 (+) Transcript_27852:836-1438(+)
MSSCGDCSRSLGSWPVSASRSWKPSGGGTSWSICTGAACWRPCSSANLRLRRCWRSRLSKSRRFPWCQRSMSSPAMAAGPLPCPSSAKTRIPCTRPPLRLLLHKRVTGTRLRRSSSTPSRCRRGRRCRCVISTRSPGGVATTLRPTQWQPRSPPWSKSRATVPTAKCSAPGTGLTARRTTAWRTRHDRWTTRSIRGPPPA